ncbi:MAG: magnesium and cobalt transport protein CorA [Actinomycetota bacterium]|nr:magnesium and cobalt transport protein CorA [Actinomycetota bacterium]
MIVDCAVYEQGARLDAGLYPVLLGQWRHHPQSFVWLGLRMPKEDELEAACAALGLDELDAAEVLAPHDRPVLGIEDGIVQMVLRTARYDDVNEVISLGEMTVLVGERALISIRHGHASPLSKLRHELERDCDRLQLGPYAVLAAIIGRVIADYRPALDGFEKDVIEVERDVFSETRTQPVRRLYKLKREVRSLLVAIDALEEPLERLIRVVGPSMPKDVQDDLAEATDQLTRTVNRTQSLSGLIDAALTASLAQISVQQNADMRRISAWVAMAAVPTMVAGIYGMNFAHFPELEWRYGYPLVIGGMLLIAGLMYRGFKRGGWF